jgi:hypothetical protein
MANKIMRMECRWFIIISSRPTSSLPGSTLHNVVTFQLFLGVLFKYMYLHWIKIQNRHTCIHWKTLLKWKKLSLLIAIIHWKKGDTFLLMNLYFVFTTCRTSCSQNTSSSTKMCHLSSIFKKKLHKGSSASQMSTVGFSFWQMYS